MSEIDDNIPTVIVSGEKARDAFAGRRVASVQVTADDEEDVPQPTSAQAVTLQDALNRNVFTWRTPDLENPVVVRFRRSKGGTRETIARILGPEQSTNVMLLREYLALASIISIDDNVSRSGVQLFAPKNRAQFDGLRKRVGWMPDCDENDWYDEVIGCFVSCYEFAMNPSLGEAMADAEASGLSPDDIRRLIKSTGLDRPKA